MIKSTQSRSRPRNHHQGHAITKATQHLHPTLSLSSIILVIRVVGFRFWVVWVVSFRFSVVVGCWFLNFDCGFSIWVVVVCGFSVLVVVVVGFRILIVGFRFWVVVVCGFLVLGGCGLWVFGFRWLWVVGFRILIVGFRFGWLWFVGFRFWVVVVCGFLVWVVVDCGLFSVVGVVMCFRQVGGGGARWWSLMII
ncbi:hypothetical protein BVRB_6g133640 [Beta vulgaris subsp. vulgaris]|nr:hypothetical protein BVRB_6g133640 [Beta vulgaris subsp. vulgaris]